MVLNYPQLIILLSSTTPHFSHLGFEQETFPFSQLGQTSVSSSNFISLPIVYSHDGHVVCSNLKSHSHQQLGQESCGNFTICPLTIYLCAVEPLLTRCVS